MKKIVEVCVLAAGLILFVISLTLLGKPGASQGVEAMPKKYSLSLSPIDDRLSGLPVSSAPAEALTMTAPHEATNSDNDKHSKDDDKKDNIKGLPKGEQVSKSENFSKKALGSTARED